jgi:hypothetical protein
MIQFYISLRDEKGRERGVLGLRVGKGEGIG